MKHSFAPLGPADGMVKSTIFGFQRGPLLSAPTVRRRYTNRLFIALSIARRWRRMVVTAALVHHPVAELAQVSMRLRCVPRIVSPSHVLR
jgi:hypothetical protein